MSQSLSPSQKLRLGKNFFRIFTQRQNQHQEKREQVAAALEIESYLTSQEL